MNTIKTYIFDTDIYPFKLEVKGKSILEAKERVKNMGHKKAYFVTIKKRPL